MSHRFRANKCESSHRQEDGFARRISFEEGLGEIAQHLLNDSVATHEAKRLTNWVFSMVDAQSAARRSAVDTMGRIVKIDPAGSVYDDYEINKSRQDIGCPS